ncbi:MAG: efflux RND transporter periplasmic adaptor subunit [Verrucomicrobiia bacterium]
MSSLFLALLAALVILSTSCKKKEAAGPPPPPAVQVMEITATNVPFDTEFIGQLDSPQNVQIRARVEAFVDKILFTEGKPVKEGDMLFELDKKPFQERLAGAKGMLAEAEAALKKYYADVARLQPLAAKKAIPQQDLDNALASVDVGKASVLSAQARVDSAMIDLGYCDVRAPISGLIGAKEVNIGELVGKGQPTLLATISTLDPIWFYCNVGETQFLKAETETRRTGKTLDDLSITLILANGLAHPAKGGFVFLDRAVNPRTGTLRLRAEFPNTEKVLRPGMFGRIKVDLGVRPNTILVPERAVSELQGKTFAWVIGADNKAMQRAVKVGETIGAKVVVLEGLDAGERVVTEGLQKVREGAVVQAMTAEEMAQAAAQNASQAEAQHAEAGAKRGKE